MAARADVPAPVVLPATFLERFPAIRGLPDAGRGMGLFVLGTRGAGKSRLLGRLVAYQDLLCGGCRWWWWTRSAG